MNVLLIIWCAQLYLTFFYVLPSGVPQVTDILLASLIGIALLVEIARVVGVARLSEAPITPVRVASYNAAAVRDIVRLCGLFVAFVFLVNTAWALLLVSSSGGSSDPAVELLICNVYYAYNWFVCMLVASLLAADSARFSFWTMITAFAAVMTQFALVVVVGGTRLLDGRMVLFCNDPNQLCFASLLVSSLYYACSIPHREKLRWLSVTDCALATVLLIICWRTDSRAGLISAVVMALVMCRKHVWFLLLCVFLVLLSAAIWPDTMLDRVQAFAGSSQRLEELPASPREFLENRELLPLFELPGYLLLGAGERGNDGRQLLGMASELHNSWASVLFAYGIGGLALIGAVFWRLVTRGGATAMVILAPTFLMASSIQGLRHTEFWALLVVVSAFACRSLRQCATRNPLSTRRVHLSGFTGESRAISLWLTKADWSIFSGRGVRTASEEIDV